MIDRTELVTAALLGTDRRPLPEGLGGGQGQGVAGDTDPAVLLLDLAARSSAAERAGAELPRLVVGPIGPALSWPVAPQAARDLLGPLLVRPQPELINGWLRTAVRHGYGVAPQHWVLLVTVAARNAELSRPLIGVALGERGRWFVQQNPQWVRLLPTLVGPLEPEPTAPGPAVDEQSVRATPEAILTAPQPWSVDLVIAALAAIGSLRLSRQTPSYAAALGVRLPVAHYPLVQSAAAYYEEQLRPGPGAILVREAFAALDGAFQTIRAIDRAFAPDPPVLDQQESS